MRRVGEARKHGRFVLHLDIDDIRELDVGALARIVRTAEHRVTEEPVSRHAKLLEARANRGFESALGVIEREFQFA